MANKEKTLTGNASVAKQESDIKIVKESFKVGSSESGEAQKATPKRNRGLFLFF